MTEKQYDKFWKKMRQNVNYRRYEDMSANGHIDVFISEDCDVHVTISGREGQYATVEFCTPFIGGGQSPRVREALLKLAEAIHDDNVENDQSKATALRAEQAGRIVESTEAES